MMNKGYDDLMKQLGDAPDEPTSTLDSNSVLNFIINNNINPGNERVSGKALYKLYKHKTKAPVKQREFVTKLNEIIIPQVSGYKTYYSINISASKIAQEAYKLAEDTKPVTRYPSFQRYFKTFLEAYQIKAGNFYIEGFVLFELYKKFNKRRHKKSLLGIRQFHNFCMLYFDNKRITENRSQWFAVTEDILLHFEEGEIDDIRRSRSKRT